MPRQSQIQDMAEVRRWFEEGRTYQWMSDEYERKYNIKRSINSWSMLRHRMGWPTRIVRDDELIPWTVDEKHRYEPVLVALRVEARRRAGKEISPDEATSVQSLKDFLETEDRVIDYDAEKGFQFVRRLPGDEDIVRQPKKRLGEKRVSSRKTSTSRWTRYVPSDSAE
jgi:hypothetical protein